MGLRGRNLLFVNDLNHHRRAASVPAEHLRFSDEVPDVSSQHRVHGIASRAAQDADDLTAVSRRHDREFLQGINAKLNNVSNGPNGPINIVPTQINGYPSLPPSSTLLFYPAQSLPPQSRISHAPSLPPLRRISTAPPSVDSRRRTWVAPTSHRVDDYEVASYLAAAPCRPYVRSSVVSRSGSVPPVLPSRAAAPRWYPSTPISREDQTRILGYRPAYRWTPPAGSSGKAAMEDIVVGVAHTSLYGDIVIGIPYKKRFMFNVQHGMDEIQDNGLPRIPLHLATKVTPSTGGSRDVPLDYTNNHFGHHVYRPLIDYHPSANKSVTVRPSVVTRRASYSGPNYVSRIPPPSLHNTRYRYDDDADDLDLLSNNYTYGRSSRYPSSTGKVYEDFTAYDYPTYEPSKRTFTRSPLGHSRTGSEPFSSIRTMTRTAQDKVNEQRSLLDRYLPGSASTNTAGPTPTPQTRNTFAKPPISEARQKVRDLLCKTKNDPHYFS